MPNEPRANASWGKRGKSPVWARVSLALGAVLVVVSGGTFAVAKLAENKVNAAIPDHHLAGPAGAAVQHAEIKGAKNILLASLDTRPSWSATHEASHTDSIIILHIAADHKQAYMLSIATAWSTSPSTTTGSTRTPSTTTRSTQRSPSAASDSTATTPSRTA